MTEKQTKQKKKTQIHLITLFINYFFNDNDVVLCVCLYNIIVIVLFQFFSIFKNVYVKIKNKIIYSKQKHNKTIFARVLIKKKKKKRFAEALFDVPKHYKNHKTNKFAII